MSEARERNLFHRAPAAAIGEGGVVDDGSGSHVDAVVGIAKTRRKEVCAQRWFFVCCQQSIALANVSSEPAF